MMEKKKVCVSLPEEQYQKIQQLADESFRTRAGYIRRVITAYLEYIEENPEQAVV